MFGAAAGGAFGAPQAGPQAEAQLHCQELAKGMEDIYPLLQQAAGERVNPATATGAQQNFVAYSYEYTDNPQVLQQANSGQFNPAEHVDYSKWVQAVQNNPHPGRCYPKPLVGLKALEARVGSQQCAVEQCAKTLEELRSGFGNLKNHLQAHSRQKLEECRQRHQKLHRQLLQVVIAVEKYAVLNSAARRSLQREAQLEDRLRQLDEAVGTPAGVRARLEELWVVLRELQQRGAPAGGVAQLGDAEAGRTLRVTESQGELLELLHEELARKKRDITQLESALARFTTPVQPTASSRP